MTPPVLFCAECGASFYPRRGNQIFCTPVCTKKHHKRRILGGMKLYDAAMLWRIERPCGALGDLTFIADELANIERSLRTARHQAIAAQKKVRR